MVIASFDLSAPTLASRGRRPSTQWCIFARFTSSVQSNIFRYMDNPKVIDRISFDILRQLANNARLSNKQVAAAVGLAPSTTHGRFKQLHSFGAYRGAHADVDLKKLGFGVE